MQLLDTYSDKFYLTYFILSMTKCQTFLNGTTFDLCFRVRDKSPAYFRLIF